MGIILFLQTLNLIILIGKIFYSFWFSYIIFLVFIGGLFILFIYIISLTYNNKFFSINYLKYFSIIFSIGLIYYLLIKIFFFINNETEIILNIKENYLNSLKFYNFPNNYINIILIIFLLILIIIVIKITNFYSGPIKTKL